MSTFQLKDLIEPPFAGEWGDEDLNGDGVFVVRTANFTTTGELDDQELVKRLIPEKKVKQKKLKPNDLIIEKSGGGPKTPVGRVIFFDKDDKETYLCNNFTAVLRPKPELVNPRYLLYQFLHFYQIRKVKQYQNQTTGLYNLKLDRYLSETVELPDRTTQDKVVAYLDNVQELIDKRTETIRLLDDYIRSVFLEMFGDPVLDNNGIGKKPLAYFGNWKSGGTPPRSKPEYFTGEIPWFTSGELNKVFISQSQDRITAEAINDTSAQSVESGSLLIGMYDTAALKSAITTVNGSCNQAIAFAKLDDTKCEVIFVYFNIQLSRSYHLNKRKGARQKNLNLAKVKGIEILNPSLDRQKKFTTTFQQVEKLKYNLNQSFDSLRVLFQAYLQNAFSEESQIDENEVFESLLANFKTEELRQGQRLQHLLDWFNKEKPRFSDFEHYDEALKHLHALLQDGSIEQVLEGKDIKLRTAP